MFIRHLAFKELNHLDQPAQFLIPPVSVTRVYIRRIYEDWLMFNLDLSMTT